jgi:RimJ/RimL family protein N-acetyltransferase
MSTLISPDLSNMGAVHIRLRTDITLAEITGDCAGRMFEWMQSAEIAEALGLTVEPTLERTIGWIRQAVQKQDIRAWAIEQDGVHVGNLVFDQFDRKAATARLSVYIGPAESRGSGAGSTAICEGLSRIFEERSLHKVWLTVHAENDAAIRAYRSLGFQVEGTLREAFVWNGRRLDALYMGLLRSEFHGSGAGI